MTILFHITFSFHNSGLPDKIYASDWTILLFLPFSFRQLRERRMQKKTAARPARLYTEVTCFEGACIDHLPACSSTHILKKIWHQQYCDLNSCLGDTFTNSLHHLSGSTFWLDCFLPVYLLVHRNVLCAVTFPDVWFWFFFQRF